MKPLFSIILLTQILVSHNIYCQIKKTEVKKSKSVEVGKASDFGGSMIWCERDTVYKDDITFVKYTISYQNAEYVKIVDIQSFSFYDVDSTFDKLYQIIMDGFNTPPKEDIRLELGLKNDVIYLGYSKSGCCVAFFHFRDGIKIGHTAYYFKKQIQKLFGKK